MIADPAWRPQDAWLSVQGALATAQVENSLKRCCFHPQRFERVPAKVSGRLQQGALSTLAAMTQEPVCKKRCRMPLRNNFHKALEQQLASASNALITCLVEGLSSCTRAVCRDPRKRGVAGACMHAQKAWKHVASGCLPGSILVKSTCQNCQGPSV